MIIPMIYGGVIATIFISIVGGCVFMYQFMKNKKNNRLIRITNWTAGKPFVEYYRGRLIWHEKLGHVYFIPKLVKERRAYIWHQGSSQEYPTNVAGVHYVPVSYYNGTYATEDFTTQEDIERECIIYDNDLKQYVKKTIKIKEFCIKPTKSSTRQFNLMIDTQIKEEFGEKKSFWDKWGAAIMGFGALFLFVVGGIIVFVLLLQYGVDVTEGTRQAPEWAQQLLNTVSAGQSPE